MDDRIFFGALIYVLIAVITSGFMPDELFSGSTPTINNDVANGLVDESVEAQGFSFLGKVLRMFFVPFVINGIPAIIGAILSIFNILMFLIAVIYSYDKLRGIGG